MNVTYWPLWVPLAVALAYELTAAATQVFHARRRLRTISEMVWGASADWSRARRVTVSILVLAGVLVLMLHFFFGLWRP